MRLSLSVLCFFTVLGAAQAETGKASYYRARGMTCAHRTMPIGSSVRVTNLANNRSVMLVVSGRGPFIRGRIVDVSTAAAAALGFRSAGVVPVSVVAAAP